MLVRPPCDAWQDGERPALAVAGSRDWQGAERAEVGSGRRKCPTPDRQTIRWLSSSIRLPLAPFNPTPPELRRQVEAEGETLLHRGAFEISMQPLEHKQQDQYI